MRMQFIRTTIHQSQGPSASDIIWTKFRNILLPFVEANQDAFESLTRMGQPFGGSVTRN